MTRFESLQNAFNCINNKGSVDSAIKLLKEPDGKAVDIIRNGALARFDNAQKAQMVATGYILLLYLIEKSKTSGIEFTADDINLARDVFGVEHYTDIKVLGKNKWKVRGFKWETLTLSALRNEMSDLKHSYDISYGVVSI